MSNKLLLSVAVTGALLSGQVLAHDNSCDIELDGQLQYYQGDLTVNMDNGSILNINSNRDLTVNGETIALTKDQQSYVNDYYNSIDTAIPMTLTIASEGLEVASVAVTEVFGELLGSGSDLDNDFQALFYSLDQKLARSFYDDAGNIRVDSSKFDEPGWFDESWEAEFEEQIESLISESMGRILIALGTQMLWEGGDMSEFEQKMERFGDDLEYRLEAKAASLEEKGNALCDVLKKADYAESKMQASIPGLDGLNLIELEGHSELRM
ncbi:hypothetical protein CW735_16290 [Alteromonas sp. MB-3u-76]|uniref:DUF2884 family protein n=1 Tax=Alteromonas sp. MB-3u-76 TaxID=2058133 RepID=UPI000C3187FC|nr:DUF2884 family protein [Alteromonas sp. MB-3u-76]AUC89553.1 hypothetical protein CW735_16290 [Alteromonas sp. MB-3u-76]